MKFCNIYTGLLLICLFIIGEKGIAQLPPGLRFETYTTRNGLPNNTIHSITQDSYGYVWVGTNNGVSRFDGKKFVNFSNTGDSNFLRNNVAAFIQADSSGRVWIANYSGLCYYNYPGNNFIYPKINGKEIQWVNALAMDRRNYLWFCCNLGLCRINTRNMYAEVMDDRSNNLKTGYGYVNTDKFDRVWIGLCKNNRYVYTNASNVPEKVNDESLGNLICIPISYSRKINELWLINANDINAGLYKWDCQKGRVNTFFPDGAIRDRFLSIWEYPSVTGDSVIWCVRPNEILLFNTNSNSFVASFKNKTGEETNFPSDLRGSHYIDRNNNLWLGSTNGLIKLNPGNQQIFSYKLSELIEQKISAPIRKIIPDKTNPDIYWLVTHGAGILQYNFTTQKIIRQYLNTSKDLVKESNYNYDGTYDKDGNFWIASGSGFMQFDEKNDLFAPVRFNDTAFTAGNTILRIALGNHHELWLATVKGLWVYYPYEKRVVHINGLNKNVISPGPEDNEPVYYLKFIPNGKLLAGTRRGLNILDTLTGEVTRIGRPDESKEIIENKNYIWGIDTDKENNIWISSNGGYVWKYNIQNKVFTDYGPANGLSNPTCRDIFVDPLSNVWVSCADGIFKLPNGGNHFLHYTTDDGLYSPYQGQGRWSIINGKIFAGYDAAFSVIDMDYKITKNDNFPVWITGMKIFDKPVYFSPDSSYLKNIQLNYTDNFLTFEFTAIDFTKPEKSNFYFMLEGFDKNWINAGNRRFATYTNLEDGKYTFRVKAMNGDGTWSSKTAALKFYVHPAFWKTWWFRLLVIGSIAFVITYFIRQRTKNIRKEAAFRQKISETEMMALQAQMNPHFIFNSLNSIENYMMRNEKLLASDYLNKFARLIRIILESSRRPLVSFIKDMEAIRLYIEMEQIRFNDQFCFQIETGAELQNGDYLVPPLLIQPFVENAIIHGLSPGEKGDLKLNITVRATGEFIHYCIADNGIGREQSRLYNLRNRPHHKSMGMEITKERLAIFKQQYHAEAGIKIDDIYDKDQKPAGTKVDLFIKAL